MSQAQQTADWNRGSSPFKGAVLGLVIERPGHGYALATRLSERLGRGWSIGPPDIYPVLNRLERSGLITGVPSERAQGERQVKIVYHPTPAAPVEFDRWMRTKSPTPSMRNELMVKIAVAREDDLPHLLWLLDDAERELLELLEEGSDDEPKLPAGSWRRLVADIEQVHTLEHWRADLNAIVRARERIKSHRSKARTFS